MPIEGASTAKLPELAPVAQFSPLDNQTDPLGECFEVPESVCMPKVGASSNFVLMPLAVPKDLLLWYQFDKNLPVDDSGGGMHLRDQDHVLAPVPVGPGVLGKGASAALDGQFYRTVSNTAALESSQSFSVTLWVYLLEDSTGSWRTIFNKASDADHLMPAMLLWPDQRRLRVRASARTSGDDGVLNSAGIVPLRRWTHIALTSTGSVLRLYINGVKDGEVILEGLPMGTGGSLYLGGDPWRAGTKAFLDDFRWYSKSLAIYEVRALTSPRLTGMGADFVHLGCQSCKYTEAVRSCGSQSHMCSLQELFAGGYHVARSMGWLASSPEVWYHNENDGDEFADVRKLGLCCVV